MSMKETIFLFTLFLTKQDWNHSPVNDATKGMMPPNVNDNLLPQVTPAKIVRNEDTRVEVEEVTECDCREVRFGIGDAIFSSLVVAPQAVSVWRGTWGIMELHPQWFPHAQIYVLGIVIHVCFALIRSQLLARSKNAWGEGRAGRWLRERVLSRVYTYIFLLACIMHWRGGWWLLDGLIDAIFPDRDNPRRAFLLAGITVLLYCCIASLRSSRNMLAPPYFLVTDGKEPTYIFATRFQKKQRNGAVHTGLRVLGDGGGLAGGVRVARLLGAAGHLSLPARPGQVLLDIIGSRLLSGDTNVRCASAGAVGGGQVARRAEASAGGCLPSHLVLCYRQRVARNMGLAGCLFLPRFAQTQQLEFAHRQPGAAHPP
ncbi:uncharacterized protein LOC123869297 isoform X7 [Maniola jurtina]|uniref:uncharacterized protein LOC123869297 isoform X7 n=1 Tax=Maniola jurtina TaxID=191418 RepID=UPI001E68798B|nr:uncharacterized protein LOC123869297 isoform X7 [Maniola jurtina]